MAAPEQPWGTCTYCGDPYPPGGKRCPTCGNVGYVRGPDDARALPSKQRRRLRIVQGFRLFIIVGVVVLLSYLMVSAAITPPTTVADPLTTSGTWTIAAGNYSVLSGNVTGADYIIGNYTVMNPAGALIDFLVFNDTEFGVYERTGNATPVDEAGGASSAQIVFSAPYTDLFHFVWVNPYAPSTGLTLSVYVKTSYESNALVE